MRDMQINIYLHNHVLSQVVGNSEGFLSLHPPVSFLFIPVLLMTKSFVYVWVPETADSLQESQHS